MTYACAPVAEMGGATGAVIVALFAFAVGKEKRQADVSSHSGWVMWDIDFLNLDPSPNSVDWRFEGIQSPSQTTVRERVGRIANSTCSFSNK